LFITALNVDRFNVAVQVPEWRFTY